MEKKAKKLGQSFLTNKGKAKKFAEALELAENDLVLEIGPGHGEITEELIKNCRRLKVIAVEKDRKLVKESEGLRGLFKKRGGQLEIITGDALKELPVLSESLKPKNYKLAGNIPYYITGHLFRTIGELKHKPEITVLGIQKEVAERVLAEPPKMNILAASVKAWGKPKFVEDIPKKDFRPQPEVNGAIVKIKVKSKKPQINEEGYYKTIRTLFSHPRKTLLNNLTGAKNAKAMEKEIVVKKLKEMEINPQDRPQKLGINEIKKISSMLYNKRE